MPADTIFWIAGLGPDTEALKVEFDDPRIHWLGAIGNNEKERRLAGADVFCVPAVGGESFGVVLLEGMAARTPVVASDIAAFKMVAEGGKSALLFENRDPTALAASLNTTLEGGEMVRARTQAGIRRAEDYSMKAQASSYVSLYEALANGDVPPSGGR